MKKLFALLLFCAVPLVFAEDINCLECHGKDGDVPINVEKFQHSVHSDLACTDCHVGADKVKEGEVFEEVHPDNLEGKTPSCTDCHQDYLDELKLSVHTSLKCWDCHGDIHTVGADKSVTEDKNHAVQMCSKCHSDSSKYNGNIKLVAHYKASTHFLKKDKDGQPVASCSDCHGSHKILGAGNPESEIYRTNVGDTCGQCHKNESEEFKASIHAEGVKKGYDESPTCTYCHNPHEVQSPSFNKKEISDLCLSCHEDQRLVKRYGLDYNVGYTYRDSYHYMAIQKNSKRSATCTDCHKTHAIMSQENPQSSINEKNLKNTCGQCHNNINEKFAVSYTHKSSSKEGNLINYYVKISYIFLIIAVIGGMILHNFIVWLGYARRAYRKRKKEQSVKRMGKPLIILHTFLFVSFFTLVVTGFALRFPDSNVMQILFPFDEEVRRWIHRIAAIVMTLAFIVHFIRILIGKEDRKVFFAMLPGPKDLKNVRENLAYSLLISDKYPSFGKVTYIEKMEYLALMWGTLVMILTGFTLWMPELASQFLPSWFIKVAETVHYYEAILATLAIIFWHFFFVIFHPGVYPMDFAWLDGKIPVEEIKHLRPEWYKELKDKGEIKE